MSLSMTCRIVSGAIILVLPFLNLSCRSKPKELRGTIEGPPIEILLCRTPKVGSFFVAGHGIIVAEVRPLGPVIDNEIKLRLDGFYRLWMETGKDSWERRDTPFIQSVPFRDENGVVWSSTGGQSWRLGDEFVMTRQDLLTRVNAVPSYRSDRRPFWEKMGAVSAREAAETILRLAD